MNRKHLLALAVAAAMSLPAQADIRLNGFGTVVAGVSEDSPFRLNRYDDDIGFKTESKFAIQAIADMGDNLTATVQVVARGSEDFEADFEWAYLSYAFNDSTTLRAGRLRIPFYRYSDYLDVGFAQPFISPPNTMYSLTFSTYDGISLLHTASVGMMDITANIIYGAVDETFFTTTMPTDGSLKNLMGMNIQASYNSWTAYGAYVTTDVDIPLASIEGLAAQLNQGGVPMSVTDNLRLNEDTGSFWGVGVTYDDGTWLFNAETSEVDIDDAVYVNQTGWYANLGYRIDSVMPYIIYGEFDTDRRTSIAAQFPAALQPTIQGVFDTQLLEYTETALGLRWDFHPSAAFKVEYKKYGDIWDRNPATMLGTASDKESMDQVRVAVDLIF